VLTILTRLRHRFHSAARDESGQVLVLAALLLSGMLGMAGLSIDVGSVAKTRHDLQNAADAAVLAGVQELPGCAGQAVPVAEDWARRGTAEPASVEVSLEGSACDTIRARLSAPAPVVFMGILGVQPPTVHADAAARIGSVSSTRRFLPWGLTVNNSNCLTADSPPQPIAGATCVLKISDGQETQGDRGALDPDGGGGDAYRENIVDGETNAPYAIGQTIPALPGNKVGPTGQGIESRLTSEPSAAGGSPCDRNGNGRDDFEEVFEDRGSTRTPRYVVSSACRLSPRIVVIPIVDKITTSGPSTILGWATLYLQGYACTGDSSGTCNGKGHWEVTGRVVDAVWSEIDGRIGSYRSGQPSQWLLSQ
jgi:hypothetical protein